MAKNIEFTDAQKEAIKAAVQKAETRTSGEIVPYFVAASDDYEETNLRAALLFILIALGTLGSLSFSWNLPFAITPMEVVLFTLAMGAVGYGLSRFVSPFRKMLIPKDLMHAKVQQRASSAFLSEEVFLTEKRTGIVILVSNFERMVEVLGDSGINEKVNKADWQQVVELIIAGIKNGDPAKGIIDGVERCGELLVEAGVDKPADNPNELSDDIRLGQ
ncbi:MAG TPA: TPM domain-containing protein [Fulvivirga sp.]|nr:TPM domain-containing protein [Fulvivirga sp.]